MRKPSVFSVIALIAVIALFLGITPVFAEGSKSYEKVTAALSVDQSDPGHRIPKGSTIYHLENDVTKVYGPDNVLVLQAKDSEAKMVQTPSGKLPATHVYSLPNGAVIDGGDDVTKIYSDLTKKTCLVTVVYESSHDKGADPASWECLDRI